MTGPVLDARSIEDLRREVAELARAYTPEWRCESCGDDPGAALAELFCTMFHQTVDRFNAVPAKLYYEFLNQIGVRELPPVPARGTMLFSPSDTVEEPVTVPTGTQVFAPDVENIVYETQWTIQATPARLLDVYFTDGERDQIRRLDQSLPMPFFSPSGESLQRHALEIGHARALLLDCPGRITLEFLDRAGRPALKLAQALAGEELRWSYPHGGQWLSFDEVRREDSTLILEKRSALTLDPDADGRLYLRCEGTPRQELRLDQALLRSAPLAPCPAQSLFSDDLPIPPEEGGYCFGRRPAPYSLFYLRSDTALSKRGAQVNLTLDLSPVIIEPEREGPVFQYNRNIIDKQGVAEPKPDDTFISGVIWEYYNGAGWRRLEVSGDKNPFSCRHEGPPRTLFRVPRDMEPTEVNAENGYYIRARVTEVEHLFSQYQRWILPFVKSAAFQWQYERGVRPDWISGENHGSRAEIPDADQYERLEFTALSPMEPGPQAMYFRFDRSPHASPLSIRFEIADGSGVNDCPQWEWWNGRQFVPAQCIDQTERLGRSGTVQIFLRSPLTPAAFFGQSGYWLRLRRTSARPGPAPIVRGIQPNTVTAVQCRREPEQFFDTGIYEAGKTVRLLSGPVQNCQVWVDERASLSAGEIEAFQREQRVRLEWNDQEISRCWIRWEPVENLALAEETGRVYALNPYDGTIRFGDGRHGRVPPAGDHNICVSYSSGGGVRGNLPKGAVNALLGGLPLIAGVSNVTPMSGGTGKPAREFIETRGNRLLRIRGRAAGRRDYEDLVLQAFPEVRHIRCFSGVNESGERVSGHVTVVLCGFASGDETKELCVRVREFLSERCSCCLAAEKRLHVRPAEVLTVHTQTAVSVSRQDLDIQLEISSRLTQLIERVWKNRPVGSQIRLDEIWQTVRQVPNVGLVHQLLAEAACRQDGADRLYSLEEDGQFPFGVVESGMHQVRIV